LVSSSINRDSKIKQNNKQQHKQNIVKPATLAPITEGVSKNGNPISIPPGPESESVKFVGVAYAIGSAFDVSDNNLRIVEKDLPGGSDGIMVGSEEVGKVEGAAVVFWFRAKRFCQ